MTNPTAPTPEKPIVYTNVPCAAPHNANLCGCGGDAVYKGMCAACYIAANR